MANGRVPVPTATQEYRKKSILGINLTGTEKRYAPSKHYVYILLVKWSDDTSYNIYRKYSDFYEFHMNLLEAFPFEAGEVDPNNRLIPYLPGKRVFQRTEVQKVASKRQVSLAEYCEALTQLPPYLVTSSIILKFFEALPSDINPPSSSTVRPEKSGLLHALLPFLGAPKKEKSKHKRSASFGSSESGLGSAELDVSGPITLERYVAVADYTGSDRKDMVLREGQVVDVVERHDNGWWFVQNDDKQGWAPASFLELHGSLEDEEEPQPLTTYEQYIARCRYEKRLPDEVSFPMGAVLDVMHKMLDGWWAVHYNGEVGLAPATYLQERKTNAAQELDIAKPIRQPTQRRCTIKPNRPFGGPKSHNKDMTLYHKMSVRMGRKSTKPEISTNEAIEVDSMEDDYENEEAVEMLRAAAIVQTNGGLANPCRQAAPPNQHATNNNNNEDEYDEAYQVIDDASLSSEDLPDYMNVADTQGNIYANQPPGLNDLSDDEDYMNVPLGKSASPRTGHLPSSQLPRETIQPPPRVVNSHNRTLPHINSLDAPSIVPRGHLQGQKTPSGTRARLAKLELSEHEETEQSEKVKPACPKKPPLPRKTSDDDYLHPVSPMREHHPGKRMTTTKPAVSNPTHFRKNLAPMPAPKPKISKDVGKINLDKKQPHPVSETKDAAAFKRTAFASKIAKFEQL